MVTQLFTIVFTDNTQLWASIQNGTVCYGTLGKGINTLVKPVFDKVTSDKICFFAETYATESEYISSYQDHVLEKSIILKNKLLNGN